ncbi:MAG: hypothetical protein WC476_12510 [Phycisphaerae bacterium]|jgi:hypothetical protein
MNIMDLRYNSAFTTTVEFNGDGVDYFDYTLEIKHNTFDSCLRDSTGTVCTWNLSKNDIDELIEGLKILTKQLEEATK